MITLDSFIPILENLPGFYLDENLYVSLTCILFGKRCSSFPVKYMLRGSITEADWARLRDYTRTVSKFIVTDDDSKARISPTVFLRLARLQHPEMPLLPYLSDLVIVDADASIAYLDILLTPSLKLMKASCIPDAQQSTFSSFLTAVEQEVPLLQTLILGPGRFLPSSLQTISQFNSLRHLELKHDGSELPFAFFDNIGSLAMLKTFILDARYVSSTMSLTGDEPTASNPSPSDNFPDSNAKEGNRNEHGAADVRHSTTFNQLAMLHVTGWLPLLEDLFHRIASTKLEDVSVTFIRLSLDELKVGLAEEAEQESKANEVRRMEKEARRKEAEARMKEAEARMMEAEAQMKEEEAWMKGVEAYLKEEEAWMKEEEARMKEAEAQMKEEEAWRKEKEAWMKEEEEPRRKEEEARMKEEGAWMKEREAWRKEKKRKMEAMEVRERLMKEQERLASLSFEVLRKLFLTSPSLKSLSLCQLGRSFQCLLKPSTLPEDVFRTMLLLPAIESLEVKGWVLDSVEGVLSSAGTIPNLKSLLLPLGEPNSGISLPTLRHVAKTCPKLESFQCYIDPLSPVPEYSIPTDVGLSHGLRTLSVGSSFPPPVAKKLGYLIARHLYLLFPKLDAIRTSEGHDAELWVIVDEFVKMFQTARMDDLNRQ